MFTSKLFVLCLQKGDLGPVGATGPKGIKGDQGDKGEKVNDGEICYFCM